MFTTLLKKGIKTIFGQISLNKDMLQNCVAKVNKILDEIVFPLTERLGEICQFCEGLCREDIGVASRSPV